jgi:hypothetical protein
VFLVDDKTMFIYKTRQKNAGRTKNKTTTPTAVAAFLRKQDKHREPINVELLCQLPPPPRLKKKKERKNRSPKPLAGVFRSAPPINQTPSSPLVFFSLLSNSLVSLLGSRKARKSHSIMQIAGTDTLNTQTRTLKKKKREGYV